jgi:pimeloyl-ACP methyl ester carboxylesterase
VPVDHDRPDGPTIDLAVARRPATDAGPGGPAGTVVVNPGGPGGSGVDIVKGGGLGRAAFAGFDVVSWDPRGVGASQPLACDESLPAYRALDWTPDDDGERVALDDGARAIAEACRRAAGALADHLSTRDSARDLDRLRQALGEEQLTYAGFSYGTALGLTYAALHPGKVRAMVLDGVADPREDLGGYVSGQAKALEAQVAAALGDGGGDYDRLLAEAEAGRGPVDPTTLAYAAIAASYRSDAGPALRAALTAADRGDGRALRTLTDGYWQAADFGAYAATVCSDQQHPQGAVEFEALADRLAGEAPRFGAVIANELRACAWWPEAVPAPAIVAPPGAPPILVLGNTGDVATPYESAVRVADAIGTSALLTYEGSGHTSMGRSACVDEHVRRYLTDLVTPPEGARCR